MIIPLSAVEKVKLSGKIKSGILKRIFRYKGVKGVNHAFSNTQTEETQIK